MCLYHFMLRKWHKKFSVVPSVTKENSKNALFQYAECRYVECRYAESRGNTKIAHVGPHDSQHNDIHHNDTQHNDTRHDDIQHKYKSNATLSIMAVLQC
jgi:hypothetical protein